MRKYDTFSDAYRSTLNLLLNTGTKVEGVHSKQSIGSNFGAAPRPFFEVQGDVFQLENPRHRWLHDSIRQPNPAFAAANFLFTISGGQDFAMITSYNSRGRQLAEDESRYEAMFGSRLFSPGHQMAYVKKKLQEDKASRRAVALIYSMEDTLLDRRDTPCAIALQFLIRNEQLDCICFMRSQSAVMVMPYDIFLFTMLQEWLSVELEIELGRYIHCCGSLHYYEEDSPLILRLVDDNSPSHAMPHMNSAGFDVILKLSEVEQRLRLTGDVSKNDTVTSQLDPYWRAFLAPMIDFHSSGSKEHRYFAEAK